MLLSRNDMLYFFYNKEAAIMARKSGEFKKRCWLAKQRLKMGYWESLKREKLQIEESDSGAGQALAAEYARVKMRRDTDVAVGVSNRKSSDEKMYRKVCDILDSNEVALNPIGQLIDRSVYDGMDAAAKQRYILELSEKFRELKERYYRERNTGA